MNHSPGIGASKKQLLLAIQPSSTSHAKRARRQYRNPRILNRRTSGNRVSAKNVPHRKRPKILPLLSGKQSVSHADVQFLCAGRYKFLTRRHQGGSCVEYVVDDHRAPLHLPNGRVVDNSARGSMLL